MKHFLFILCLANVCCKPRHAVETSQIKGAPNSSDHDTMADAIYEEIKESRPATIEDLQRTNPNGMTCDTINATPGAKGTDKWAIKLETVNPLTYSAKVTTSTAGKSFGIPLTKRLALSLSKRALAGETVITAAQNPGVLADAPATTITLDQNQISKFFQNLGSEKPGYSEKIYGKYSDRDYDLLLVTNAWLREMTKYKNFQIVNVPSQNVGNSFMTLTPAVREVIGLGSFIQGSWKGTMTVRNEKAERNAQVKRYGCFFASKDTNGTPTIFLESGIITTFAEDHSVLEFSLESQSRTLWGNLEGSRFSKIFGASVRAEGKSFCLSNDNKNRPEPVVANMTELGVCTTNSSSSGDGDIPSLVPSDSSGADSSNSGNSSSESSSSSTTGE